MSAIFTFDNSYARDLEGLYLPWTGAKAPAPQVLRVNEALALELGNDPGTLRSAESAAFLTGTTAPEGAAPLAMAYAGHQFGGFSPQLGDGRALLLGEVIDRKGKRRDIQLKGSGRTPFSRGGDGKAHLGPVLREFLIGEAMHALGVPTTRALAASLTGEMVWREGGKPGAVLARVASSHLRVGTFQFFAARGETDRLRQLANYAISRHFPDLKGANDRYLQLLSRVSEAQARLVAQWVNLGFVHGVMNTDNVAISGETIDYGPCAFIDVYDPKAVFSSIDRNGRYAYGNQPNIAQWNLARFAESLLDLIDPEDSEAAIAKATEALNHFPHHYQAEWLKGVRAKLGLMKDIPRDLELANDLLALMAESRADFTQTFRSLSDVARGSKAAFRDRFLDLSKIDRWLESYAERSSLEDIPATARAAAMDQFNPIYIPRNHKVEEALEAAERGEMAHFDRLLAAITSPFEAHKGLEAYAEPAPDDFGPYTTYCGT